MEGRPRPPNLQEQKAYLKQFIQEEPVKGPSNEELRNKEIEEKPDSEIVSEDTPDQELEKPKAKPKKKKVVKKRG